MKNFIATFVVVKFVLVMFKGMSNPPILYCRCYVSLVDEHFADSLLADYI